MRVMFIMALIFAAVVLPAVHAIPNYQQCLDCFYANRTQYYYCQSNQRCLPIRSTQCAANQIIYKDFQCVNGFQECTNVTLTQFSVGQSLQYGFGLAAGYGCYLQLNRLPTGSYGTLSLSFDDPSQILVFDSLQRQYQSGMVLGLPLSEDGWGPRKVFVVNRGDQPAGFTVEYIGGLFTQVSFKVIATLLSITFVMVSL